LLTFFLFALPATVALFFVRKEVFYAWLKTMIWFIPLATLNIFTSDVTPGGWLNLYTQNRQEISFATGKYLVAVTLIVFAWKYWRLKRQEHLHRVE
jgi:hypothetical protein